MSHSCLISKYETAPFNLLTNFPHVSSTIGHLHFTLIIAIYETLLSHNIPYDYR